ncbi:MAG: TGS domain-containing protein [Hyphomicrobiaceae bacterium]|nr:TGS domain-containing protein [Hyphomicrobiaceae bacterium]
MHTKIGNTAIGTVVNGRQLSISIILKNGDEVNIKCS